MSARPTSWPRGLLMILEHTIARGVDRGVLERRLGVSVESLRTREARISLDLYYRGVEVCAELLDAPHFGLDFIDGVEPRVLDALGFLAASAPTVGEAFARIFRYFRFMVDAERFELSVCGRDATFSVVLPDPPRPAHAHVTEMYLADCVLLAPRMSGHRAELRSLKLRHRVPDPEAFAARVGFASPELGADRNEWTIDVALLDAPMPRPDPALSAFLEGILAPQAKPFLDDEPIDARVRALLAHRLALGAPSLAEVARELGIAPRTLQRRLAAADASFDALLESVRKDVFARCRARGLSMEDTAVLCGYADASSFHRARRRWLSG